MGASGAVAQHDPRRRHQRHRLLQRLLRRAREAIGTAARIPKGIRRERGVPNGEHREHSRNALRARHDQHLLARISRGRLHVQLDGGLTRITTTKLSKTPN